MSEISKKLGRVTALVCVGALSGFFLSCGSSSSRPSGVLYVLTEGLQGVGNVVSSFAIDLDNGNLSMINANANACPTQSTDTNPEPCGLPLGIALDPTGNVAFVLDQGLPASSIAPTIYAYKVTSDGSLSTSSTPAATLAVNELPIAMNLDAAGQFLYVLDAGTGTLPSGGCPLSGVSSSTNYLGCPAIWVFQATSGSSTLTAASGSPFYIGRVPTALSPVVITPPSGVSGPCGGGASQELLYVTNDQDLTANRNDNTLSVYCTSSAGALTEQTGSPYTTNSDPVSVLAVDTQPSGSSVGGVFVYVGTKGSSAAAIGIFQLCLVATGNNNCTPQEIANAEMAQVSSAVTAGLDPVAMQVDPTNNFFYVASQGTNQVFGFRISSATGGLVPLSPPNQPTGSQPVSLALRASTSANPGQFLYVSNFASSNITGFSLSTTTGAMSSPITQITPPEPGGMATP